MHRLYLQFWLALILVLVLLMVGIGVLVAAFDRDRDPDQWLDELQTFTESVLPAADAPIEDLERVVTAFAERRSLPPSQELADAKEVAALRDAVADMGTRLHRLEEERDFYKDLLETPGVAQRLGSGVEPAEEEVAPPDTE